MQNMYNPQFLNECFELREDGTLIWTTRPAHHFKNDHGMNIFNAKYPGKPVGPSRGPRGHLTVPITYQGVKRLRPSYAKIVYMLHHGCEVANGFVVDHIDGDPSNNHPDNLRAIPIALNNRNASHAPGKSGIKGVRMTTSGKYEARIGGAGGRGGEWIYLGSFDTAAEAIAARHGAGRVLGYTDRHLKDSSQLVDRSN